MNVPDWKTFKFATESIQLVQPTNEQFLNPIRNGSTRVGLHAPENIDDQAPHTQDELYIVFIGNGRFNRGDERVPFKPQDVMFVAVGTIYSFEDFTTDLAAWAIFWGEFMCGERSSIWSKTMACPENKNAIICKHPRIAILARSNHVVYHTS